MFAGIVNKMGLVEFVSNKAVTGQSTSALISGAAVRDFGAQFAPPARCE